MLEDMSKPEETTLSTARVPACDVSHRQSSRASRLRTTCHGREIKFSARKVDRRGFVGKKTRAGRKAAVHIRLHGWQAVTRIGSRQVNLEPTNGIKSYRMFPLSHRRRQHYVENYFLVIHLNIG